MTDERSEYIRQWLFRTGTEDYISIAKEIKQMVEEGLNI